MTNAVGQNLNNVDSIRNTTKDAKREYWDQWLLNAEAHINPDDTDHFEQNFYNLMKLAIDNEQYLYPEEDFIDVKRVVKFRIDMSREMAEKMFGVEIQGVYGIGVFTLLDGILLDERIRADSNYDTFKQKGKYFDLSMIPDDVVKEHDFRLATPALGGLFVPKKSEFVSWLDYIQYFDIML